MPDLDTPITTTVTEAMHFRRGLHYLVVKVGTRNKQMHWNKYLTNVLNKYKQMHILKIQISSTLDSCPIT